MKEPNLNNVTEKTEQFYKKPSTNEEAWENIKKLKEIHDPETKERVIIKLDDSRKNHKFVYMDDDKENKYVVALPVNKYNMHPKICDLEEKLLKRWGKGEKIKKVFGGGWVTTRQGKLIISGKSDAFGEAPKEEVVEILKKAFPEVEVKGYPLKIDIEDYKDDLESVLEIIEVTGKDFNWSKLPDSLRNNRDFFLKAIKKSPSYIINYASENLRNDKEFILEMIKNDSWLGSIFEHISEKFTNNKEFVLEAVRINGSILELDSFPNNLKNDKEVVIEAVKENPYILNNLPEIFRADKEIALEAVRQDGEALEFLSENLKNDKEIVIEAIKADGFILSSDGYISENLRNDKEVVLEAVKATGRNLKHVLKRFKDDKEVVLEAVKKDKRALEYASKRLQEDPDIINIAK